MRFGFYSCMTGMPWGGSEELWWRTARKLQVDGDDVCVNYKWWPETARQLVQLEDAGGQLWLRNRPSTFWQQQLVRLGQIGKKYIRPGRQWLDQTQPDAVLVTLGFHPDRIEIATDCHEAGIPYAINVQCASNTFFIHSDCLEEYRQWYRNARRVYFVSEENQKKMEVNLAMKLDNCEIIANPFNMRPDDIPDWPDSTSGFSLACVGRLHFQSKGQDAVVEVMRQQKWRERELRINFYGSDQGNRKQLEEMIRMYELEDQLTCHGFCHNIREIWEANHGLLLPSRYEGAALVIVEAMLSNRIAVATDTGRNRELLNDGETGFIADSATANQLDDALERAWQVRHEWRERGLQAGRDLRQNYTLDPIGDFAETLRGLVRVGATDGKLTSAESPSPSQPMEYEPANP